jgi:hypothetical protein
MRAKTKPIKMIKRVFPTNHQGRLTDANLLETIIMLVPQFKKWVIHLPTQWMISKWNAPMKN